MKTTLISKYTSARTALEQERIKLAERMEQIDTVLNGTMNGHVRSESPRRPSKNKVSLREAVTDALKRAGRALSKQEILAAIQARGYTFTTNDPINSLGAMLYSAAGKKQFRNDSGKFSAK